MGHHSDYSSQKIALGCLWRASFQARITSTEQRTPKLNNKSSDCIRSRAWYFCMMPVTGTAGASGSPPQPLAKSQIRKERSQCTMPNWNLPYFSSCNIKAVKESVFIVSSAPAATHAFSKDRMIRLLNLFLFLRLVAFPCSSPGCVCWCPRPWPGWWPVSGVRVTQPRPRVCCVGLCLFLGFSCVFLVVLCFAVLASKGILFSSRLSVRHAFRF